MPKVSLVPNSQVLSEALARDAELAKEWERLQFARLVASKVIAYRAEHDLSQRRLAVELLISQPQVARLESGVHEPSYGTLMRLAGALGMEFTIDIKQAGPSKPRANDEISAITREDLGAVMNVKAA